MQKPLQGVSGALCGLPEEKAHWTNSNKSFRKIKLIKTKNTKQSNLFGIALKHKHFSPSANFSSLHFKQSNLLSS